MGERQGGLRRTILAGFGVTAPGANAESAEPVARFAMSKRTSQPPWPMKMKSTCLLSASCLASVLACSAPLASGAAADDPAPVNGAGVAGTPAESMGMRQERIKETEQADANGPVAQAGPSVAGIREATFDSREGISAQIAARVDDDEKTLGKLKMHVAASETGANFTTAMADVGARRKVLRSDLKAAPSITADGWGIARADLAADYGAYVESAARARALAASGPVEASAMLDAGTTIDSVHTADFEARVQAVAAVKAKLGASERAVAALGAMADSLQGDSKAAFRVAIVDMKDRQKRLEASLSSAEKASADDWTLARAQLAADYGAYAEAVAQAEFAASGSRS